MESERARFLQASYPEKDEASLYIASYAVQRVPMCNESNDRLQKRLVYALNEAPAGTILVDRKAL